MSIPQVAPLNHEGIIIQLKDDADAVKIVFSGVIEMREPSKVVLPYLITLHDTLVQCGIKHVIVDFLDLIFVNSSGIKSIISWIMKLNDLPSDKRYSINIVANDDIAWQGGTLPVLKKLFPNYLVITT